MMKAGHVIGSLLQKHYFLFLSNLLHRLSCFRFPFVVFKPTWRSSCVHKLTGISKCLGKDKITGNSVQRMTLAPDMVIYFWKKEDKIR